MTEAEPEAKGAAWKCKMVHFVIGSLPALGHDQQPGTTAVSWPVTDRACLHYWVRVFKEKSRKVVQALATTVLLIIEQHSDHDKPFEQLLAPLERVPLPQTTPASRKLRSPLSTAATDPPGCFTGHQVPDKGKLSLETSFDVLTTAECFLALPHGRCPLPTYFPQILESLYALRFTCVSN